VRLAYAEAMQKDRDRRWGGGKLGVPLSGQLVYVGLFSFIQYLVGGLEQLDYFPYIGNNHPNWLIFFRGVKPPTR
jgi:hypothetical protein